MLAPKPGKLDGSSDVIQQRRFTQNVVTTQADYFASQVFVSVWGREDYARSLRAHEEPAHNALARAG